MDEFFGEENLDKDNPTPETYIPNLLKLQKIWDDFKHTDFFEIPSKKPCFLAGTIIHTTVGLIAIEKIEKETEVYCYDEVKQLLITEKTNEIYTNFTEKYLIIHTENGEKLNVTGQYSFYQKSTNT